MDKRDLLTYHTPAGWYGEMWKEALPCGNGEIGALVYGGIRQETILFNHSKLWHWGRSDKLPDVSHTLKEVRELMDAGEYERANHVTTDALLTQGYESTLELPLPLVDLKVQMENTQPFKQYARSIEMSTGEVCVKWAYGDTNFKRNLFISRKDECAVYEISCDKGVLDSNFMLAFHQGNSSATQRKLEEIGNTLERKVTKDTLYFAAQNDDGPDYGAVAKLTLSEGATTQVDNNILRVSGATKILIVLKLFVKENRDEAFERLEQAISKLEPSYETLFKRHALLHKKLYKSCEIQLCKEPSNQSVEQMLLDNYQGEIANELIEKLWRFGRYLFVSGSKEGGMPFPLYGLWCGDYNLWWTQHMANENVQMIYWHASVGGLGSLIKPLMDYYVERMSVYQDNAQKLFGCRGIYIPAGTTPNVSVPNQLVPVITNWTGAAGWLAQTFYEYAIYHEEDQLYITGKILPFMKEVALFYEDFLVIDENGQYKSYPSVSPENSPGNYIPEHFEAHMSHPMPTTINATLDFAILKELLTHLIEGATHYNMYTEECIKWKEMLTYIPPYQISEEGYIKEWMHEDFRDNFLHRHLSHIYPIFPGKEYTIEENPEITKAFATAVSRRELGGQVAWSFMHMASIYARLGLGQEALECFDNMSKSCLLDNLLSVGNDWRHMGMTVDEPYTSVIQLDANLGFTHAVQEMLIYVSSSMIKLLPALPKQWRWGKAENLHIPGGVVTLEWNKDKEEFRANFTATTNLDITVKLPSQFQNYQVKGVYMELNKETIRINMSQGEKVILYTR